MKFAKQPDSVDTVLNLDDTVIWGSLHLIRESKDKFLSDFADRLLNRRLFKCFDIRTTVSHKVDPDNSRHKDLVRDINKCCASVTLEIQERQNKQVDVIPRIILDEAKRSPYKSGDSKHEPGEQIMVRTEGGKLIDIRQRSEIVKSLTEYKLNRIYYDSSESKETIEKVIDDVVKREIN